MQTSNQINEAPKPEEYLQQESDSATIEVVEDIDEETHDQIQEFYEILEEIKKRPDFEMKIAQVMGTLRILAGKPAESDDESDEADDEEDESPLKQAPASSARSQQIFKNFRDATVALIECEDTPRKVCDVIAEMLDELGSECGGHAEPENKYAFRVISKVFDLDDEGEEEAQRPASTPTTSATPPAYKEVRAEQFTLVDHAGNVRARLHIVGKDAVLTMRDSQGRPRLRLRAGDKEAMITVCGERGEAGKGVLPATDEVERVRIGYDELIEQDARIVLQDGNERECASVEIGDGEREAADGFLRLKNPASGGYTIIDSEGLTVFDGKSEPLPAPEPTPVVAAARNGADDDDNQRDRVLSDQEAEALAEELFSVAGIERISKEANQLAAVVMKIIDLFAYELDGSVRESNKNFLSFALYVWTDDCARRMSEFAEAAGGGRGSKGSIRNA